MSNTYIGNSSSLSDDLYRIAVEGNPQARYLYDRLYDFEGTSAEYTELLKTVREFLKERR